MSKLAKIKLVDARTKIDPSADDNSALRWASINGHDEIVQILLADIRVAASAISK